MAYRFQKILESATDQTLVEPNWEAILECVDMIRGGEVPVKDALKIIQKRYNHTNPHISHHALMVLEACVKNCGKKFIAEIATKEFMEDMRSLVVSNPPELVRNKILELIQCWTSAFKGIAEYKIVGDTHSLLKMNGFEFPPIDEAKAMFLADSAPDWAEGDNCYRCRVEFGVFTRKHHCRACGQIFCDRCSNKQMLLPHFGIEKKVRVCEACFDKSQTGVIKGQPTNQLENKAAEEAAAREKALKEAQAKEQEELELALAISQSEAEAKEQGRFRSLYQSNNIKVNNELSNYIEPSKTEPPAPLNTLTNNREEFALSGMADEPAQEQPFDSILSKYLDRDYWERKRKETEEQAMRATAPPPSEISISISSSVSQQQQPHQQNGILGGKTPTTKTPAAVPNNNSYALNETLQQEMLDLDVDGLMEAQPPMVGGIGSAVAKRQQQIDEIARNYAKMNLDNNLEMVGGNGGEEEVAETSQFCRVLKERIDTMNTRMKSNQLRGRSIVNDSAIHSLFSQLTDLHGAVLHRMTKLEEGREHFERLQDHLAHIQEARQAINALREETERQRQEKLREEQSRRQTQLRQKLEVMRNKKHEMLMTERYAAIQKFQEQERQIRQQRFQQSPQTIGGGAGAGMMEMPMPMQHQSTPIPMMNTSTSATTTPMVSQMQLPPSSTHHYQHQQMPPTPSSIPPTIPSTAALMGQIPPMPTYLNQPSSHVSPMPTAQIMSTYSGGANIPAPPPPMVMPYSMPTSQQPFFSSPPQPQMMYSSPAPTPMYHHNPMTHQHLHGMNPQFHHQMPPQPQQYPQYMAAHQHQQMQNVQQQQPAIPAATESSQEQQQKGTTTLVPEDLLISFD